MIEPTFKDRVLRAVERMPEDTTFEDVMECVVLLHKIEVGLAQIRAGQGVPHAEVVARLREHGVEGER